jgi:hypothetical protein
MVTAAERRSVLRVLRALFVIVAVVAGIAGIIMLIAPASTDRYFSWPIGPQSVAATVGGFYVASAFVFGLAAIGEDWPGARGLCFGVLALTIPTLAATARHHDVFDFGRWQAVAWVTLFVASPLAYGTILVLQRGRVTGSGEQLRRWVRPVLWVLATGYAALAVVIWFALDTASERAPFALMALSGRFLGCWAAFLAVLAAFAAICNRWNDARIPLLALAAWPAGALLAALTRYGDLESGRRVAYTAVVVIVLAVSAAMVIAGRDARHRA